MRLVVFVVFAVVVGLAVLLTGGIHDQFTAAQKVIFPILGFTGATLMRAMRRVP